MVHIYLCNVLQNHSFRPYVFKNGGTVTLKSNAHLMSRLYMISESIVNIKLIRVLLGQHWTSTFLALLVDAPP